MNCKSVWRLITVVVLTTALITGCGGASGGGLTAKASEYDFLKKMAEEEKGDEENEKSEPGVKTELPALTGIDGTVNLTGIQYTLPFDLTELLADGWTGNYNLDTDLDGMTQTFLYLTKDGLGDTDVSFYIFNNTGNTKKIRECQVAGLEVDENNAGKAAFSLSNGLTVGDDMDTVKERMGLPTDTYDGDHYIELAYGENQEKGMITFLWPKDESYIASIEVEHYVVEETASSEEVPAYLSEYSAPSSMGEDFDSGIFSLDGVLYQLSCPLSELIENGWHLTKDEAVPAGNTAIVYLRKKDAEISAYVRNYADNQVPSSNCALYKIGGVYLDLSSAPDLLLPKGFSLGVDQDELESILDSSSFDFEKDDTHETLTSYIYNDYSKRTELYVSYDKEDKRIYSIRYERDVWP